MLQDLRFGLKLLWKQKAFTLAALLTLALCIGANTAIFTVLDGVVLRGLPYPQSDRLVTLFNTYPGVGVEHGANSVPDYGDRRKLTDVFDDVALFGSSGYDVGLQGSPRRINGQYVTPSYFHILGVQPLLGRTFTEQEAVRGKEKVAILSEGLWKEMFSGDRGVLGKDIRLTGELYRIVGVMPDGFGVYGNDPRLWVPFAFEPRQTSDDARHSNSWSMIARLRPGVSLAYAQQRIHALNKAITDRFPKLKPLLENARFATRVVGLKDEMVRDIRPTLYLLQAAVAVVLLIGCVNLANLMLVRSQVRLKELGIRSALGAGRRRLGRQLLTESVALALLGGALGLGVGFGSVRLLARLGASELPRAAEIRIDGGVLAFTAAIAVLTGLIFGSVPLVHLFKRDLNQVFRENDRAGTLGVRAVWVRSALVVSQVSLAFVLLIGSALLTLSFLKLLDVDPGFRSEDVITARFSLPANRYSDDARARTLTSGLLDRLRSLPGVRHAGVTTFLPFSGEGNASVAMIEGYTLAPGENPPVPGWNTVDSGYFAAMGIPLIEGRYFNGSDSEGARKVVIIDQFLARKYWRGRSPLGGRLLRGIEKKENEFATIVGVVGSVNTGDLADRSERGQIYFHYPQYVPRTMHVVLKTGHDAALLTPAVRGELRQADPELPLFDTKTMRERISLSLTNRRAAMVLCLMFGGLALLLSAIGLYGVLAYSVAQRTREFGIRMALGAEARAVLGMVLADGARLAAAGLAIGIAGAFALTRLMSSMLYDVRPADPRAFLIAGLVLATVAIVAALIPSWRAVRIHPAAALRHE